MRTRSLARSSSGRPARRGRALAALLLAAGLALTGCGGSDHSSGDSAAKAAAGGAARDGAAEDAPGTAGSGAGRSGTDGTARTPAKPDHVIRTASLSVRVKDVPKALEEARAVAEDAGGHVGSETTVRRSGREHTRVVLRVPVAAYERVLDGLEGTGRLLERSSQARDVTDQVVDVDSRIASQRASVARVRELMERATKLSDVVTLEGELSARQADLEALLARQASLRDRTSLATITLSLSRRAAPDTARNDDEPGFGDALAGGWDAFVTMLRWLLVALGAVLPFVVAAALLVLGWLRLVRPRLPRRPAPSPVPAPAASSSALPAHPAGDAAPGTREDG